MRWSEYIYYGLSFFIGKPLIVLGKSVRCVVLDMYHCGVDECDRPRTFRDAVYLHAKNKNRVSQATDPEACGKG